MCELSEFPATPMIIGEELTLSDIFYTNSSKKKKNVFQVKLSSKGFCLRRESAAGVTHEQNLALDDIIGGRCMRSNAHRRSFGRACTCSSSSTTSIQHSVEHQRSSQLHVSTSCSDDESAYLYVFAYVLKKNLRSVVRRERTVLTLRFRSFDKFEDNIREAEKWHRALKWHQKVVALSRPVFLEFNEQKRMIVLLNPKSGSGKARELFNQQVVPVLNEAEIPYDLYVTKYPNYARDFVRNNCANTWVAIVAVGGDGLFFELLNGLLQRSDWSELLKRIPLGIVPCGSGNGLARTIAHLYQEPYDAKPVLCAALTIARGRTAPMDVVRIEQKSGVCYSFLSVGWGFISDIDIESEHLRSLGHQRFTLWSLRRLISLRTYKGKISYHLKDDNGLEATSDVVSERKNLFGRSASCSTHLSAAVPGQTCSNEFEDVISLETSANQSYRSRCDSWFSAASHKSTFYSIPESIYHSVGDSLEGEPDVDLSNADAQCAYGPASSLPALIEPVPDSWIVEEGEFIMVHAAYQTHLGEDCFFAPAARLNDGTIFLVIIRSGASRTQLFNFLISLSSGTHLPAKNNECIKVVAVNAFRIEPLEKDGIMTVDGERIEFGPLQAEIFPALTHVLIPK